MTALPWMLVRLALETGAHHAAADSDRLALMEVRTIEQYRSGLARIYGFECAVEDAIVRIADLEAAVLVGRDKAELLEEDLLALGLPGQAIVTIPRLANVPLRSPAHAIGWLFVIERATLFAGVLRRQIERTLGASVAGAVHYLSAYERPGARFRALGEHLGTYALRYTPESIVSAANEAFRAQRQWYRADRPVIAPLSLPVAGDVGVRASHSSG